MRNTTLVAMLAAAQVSSLHAAPGLEIRELGSRPPAYADATRQKYHASADLYSFVGDVLPDAAAGSGAAQYHLYLALDECAPYLRLSADEAKAQHHRLLAIDDEWSTPEEDGLLVHTYSRCRGFAGGDLAALVAAMGVGAPGVESEYASHWFERAVSSSYPPALADLALRPIDWDAGRRGAVLQEAVATGDADVLLQLFRHASSGETAASMPASALVWLIMACRAGADCGAEAPWFRAAACDRSNTSDPAQCVPGRSAVEHYWLAKPAPDRLAAYRAALIAESELQQGRLGALPWATDLGLESFFVE